MKDSTISASQAGMLCTIILLANKISLLPALLYQGAKADGLFVVIFHLVIELSVLGIFFMLKFKFPELSLKEILEKKLGKVVTRIIFVIFMVFFLFKLLLSYSVGYVYLKQNVYQGEYALFALICFIPVINHAVMKGLRVFSRTIELYYYIVCAGLFICLGISLFGNIKMPLFFTSTSSEFFSTMFKHIFSFGDYVFLFLLIDKIDLRKENSKDFLKFVGLGIFFVLAIIYLFFSLYQITAFMHNNALADITVTSVLLEAVGRLDVFAMVTRMFLTFFEMEIFHFAFSEAFCGVFSKLNRGYSVFFFDVIFAVSYFVLVGRFENMIIYTKIWLPYLGIVACFLVPLVIFFIALPTRKGGKYEKNY